MAHLTDSQIPNTLRFLQNDFPELLKSIGQPEDTDEYWQEVLRKCNETYEQTGKKLFNKMMINTLAEYLEIQDRMRKDKNLTEVDVRWKVKVR